MIKRIVNLYWELRYRWKKYWWDKTSKKSVINGLALMYHHVTDDFIDINESCKCKVDEFRGGLNKIQNEGRRFVSVDEMLSILDRKSSEPFAVVTFDDVPDNFFTNAYPILRERSIPFILFLTTSFIGKQGYLSEKQIKELDRDPLCTIGAHTLTHPMLRRVSNSKEELTKAKHILEERLGHSVDYMAYPYGRQSSVSRRIMREARDAGYLCAFGTIQSPITDTSSNNFYYIPRIVNE